MREEDWDSLLMLIRMGKCTPFIGSGSSYPYLPLAGKLADDWSEKYHYPLKDSNDLAKVSSVYGNRSLSNVSKACYCTRI